jgi:hypothetical protein
MPFFTSQSATACARSLDLGVVLEELCDLGQHFLRLATGDHLGATLHEGDVARNIDLRFAFHLSAA